MGLASQDKQMMFVGNDLPNFQREHSKGMMNIKRSSCPFQVALLRVDSKGSAPLILITRP